MKSNIPSRRTLDQFALEPSEREYLVDRSLDGRMQLGFSSAELRDMREDGEALENCLDALQYLVDHQVPYLAREFSELVDPEGEFELEDDSEEAFVAFVRSCEARYGIPIDLANEICRYWM